MAIVINPNEIMFNSVRYPLTSQVRPSLMSKQPEKQVTGDYSLETNPVVSTWGMKRAERGILLEDLDEGNPNHQGMDWWSTCDSRFSTVLPPLATTVTLPSTIVAPSIVNANMELDTADWANGARSSAQAHGGTYSWLINTGEVNQVLAWDASYQSKAFMFECWVYSASGTDAKIGINDGVGTTYSQAPASAASWVRLRVTRVLDAAATRIQLLLNDTAGGSYFDDAAITGQTTGNVVDFAEFNSNIYAAQGNMVTKLNGAGTAFTAVGVFPATVTKLVSTLNSVMLVYAGDSANYWYMSTADVFIETNETAANTGVIWDAKAFKISTTGNFEYTTTPNSATPTWSDSDSGFSFSSFPTNIVQEIGTYREADGDLAIYAATKEGLWAYDFANFKWIKTELTLPSHATVGMGMVHWRSGLFISNGAQVYRYVAGSVAEITALGLTQFDGLPTTRGGAITKMIRGHDDFFALVDSTYEGATSRSTIMAYDGRGWRCVWEATADNKNMYSGIFSSVVQLATWISNTDGVFWIPQYSYNVSPKKVSGYTYAAAGVRITPWFDANAPGVNKLALRLKVKSNDCAASNETIVVKYRIDKANTDIGTGWTTLGTISTDTTTTYDFASSVGTEFKEIQFRFDLARGSTTTNSPELEWFSLEYLRANPVMWGYTFTIDCSKPYAGNSAAQLVDAIRTATALGTLADLSFRNDTGGTETYKCRVWDIDGNVQTGETKTGQFTVTAVAP